MGPEVIPGIFLAFIAVAICLRLFAGGIDKDRVRDYITGKGGRVVSIEWNPFGKGWFGERDSRIYEVHYHDKDGNTRRATCKTSMFSGVYFTEDVIVKPARPASPAESLSDVQAENLRLRRELERLKSGRE